LPRFHDSTIFSCALLSRAKAQASNGPSATAIFFKFKPSHKNKEEVNQLS